MDDSSLRAVATRTHGSLELVHIVGYFAPECAKAYEGLGLHPLLAYFPARSAAMGAVTPAVTVATFYVFAPSLVEMALPGAWEVTTPEAVLEARHASISQVLHRELGDPDLTEALDLVHTACDAMSPAGRTLYAAHAALPWPEDPLMALWHGATLLREFRGDGHLIALQLAGLDPVEAISLHGRVSGQTSFLKATRGWADSDWAAAEISLFQRGIIDEVGNVTEAGAGFKQGIESATLDLSMAPWKVLGEEGCTRLLELVTPLRKTLQASGIFPGFAAKQD